MTPSKRAAGRQQPNESPSSQKKRKQLSMDDYLSSVCGDISCIKTNQFSEYEVANY